MDIYCLQKKSLYIKIVRPTSKLLINYTCKTMEKRSSQFVVGYNFILVFFGDAELLSQFIWLVL